MTEHVSTADMQPDLDEVQQVESDDKHVVPVEVVGPAEVRELPSIRIAPRTVTVDSVAGGKLLAADPRRKFATIIARTQDIVIGGSQSQAQLTGAWFPKLTPFQISTVGQVWAISSTGTTDVSVIEEYWA